jgi:cytochrome c peroxidase
MNKVYLLPLFATIVFACGKDGDGTVDTAEIYAGYNYEDVQFPEHFQVSTTGGMGGGSVLEMDNTPEDNPITNDGANLGRFLFYDSNLSANGTIACASCHMADSGFADPRTLSLGFEGGETARHSMGLTNARFYESGMFFWDQRAETLEDQVLQPFQDAVEMGMTLETLVSAVESQGFYPEMFEMAFGDSEVTSDRISKALAQYVRSIVSFGSRYDDGRAQVSSAIVDFPNFTDEENLGKEIFMNTPMGPNGAGCAVCHQGEAMVATAANNNGLDLDSSEDEGYGIVTGKNKDMGMFKAPSLRNVGLRGSFMHDGRFTTLREVVDHYVDSVQPHANLGMPLNMHEITMSETKRDAVVAFLETLTDWDMIADPRFASPFE